MCKEVNEAPQAKKTAPRPSPSADAKYTITPGKFKDNFDIKILTLGPGEGGKTTINRQIKIHYAGGYSSEEREQYKSVIKSNCITDIKLLVAQLESSGSKVDQNLETNITLIQQLTEQDIELTPDVAEAITDLWNDPAMKDVYKSTNSLGIGENASYFFDNIERIATDAYVPTDEDILKSRIKTIGSAQMMLNIKYGDDNAKTVIMDFGGQNSERGKWKNSFSDVDLILFIISLSDFDQTMFEDKNQSRTQDAMSLFSQILTSSTFQKTPCILIMNKIDIFSKKLQEAEEQEKFREIYPGFTGDISNVEQAIEHVKASFQDKVAADRQGSLDIFCINALETESIDKLIQAISKKTIEIYHEKNEA